MVLKGDITSNVVEAQMTRVKIYKNLLIRKDGFRTNFGRTAREELRKEVRERNRKKG